MIRRVLSWLCAVVMLFPQAVQAQRPFDPKDFRVEVHTMFPARYGARLLTGNYRLEMRGDTVGIYLPYMGRVYRPALDNDGLDFEVPVTDFRVKERRKGITRITFRARRKTVVYDFSIDVMREDGVEITLKPDNAELVHYEGRLITGD